MIRSSESEAGAIVEKPPALEGLRELAAMHADLSEAVIGTTLDNIILSWNPAAARLYGYRANEAIGQSLERLVTPVHLNDAAEIMLKVRHGERVRNLETIHVGRDGKQINVVLSIWPVRERDGTISSAIRILRNDLIQPANREGLDMEAHNRALVMDAASRVALDILSSRTGVEALRHIADAARVLAGAQYAALGVARPDGPGLVEFVTVGMTPAQEAAVGARPFGAGILGLLLTRTRPLRIRDLAAHPASVGFPPNHPVMTSFLGMPIRRGERVLGSLYLTNKQDGDEFTEADQTAVEALSEHAAVAIHNLQMISRQRALVSGLINAQEEERRAIAYDLHDGLTQYVMASHAHIEAFRRAHQEGKTDRAARELDQGLQYLKEAVIESRRLVNGLRSLALDDLGLLGALELLLSDEKARAEWNQADLIQNIGSRRFDKSLETAAYRVAQEALTNARKHAETTRVQLTILAETDDQTGAAQLRLEVRDWGKGFVPEQRISEAGRVGLQGMSERVSVLGGQYELRSAPGEGATIRAIFPIIGAPDE